MITSGTINWTVHRANKTFLFGLNPHLPTYFLVFQAGSINTPLYIPTIGTHLYLHHDCLHVTTQNSHNRFSQNLVLEVISLNVHYTNYTENSEGNFMSNTLYLKSYNFQNKSVQTHHHSCTKYIYSILFYHIMKQVVCHYTTVWDKIMYLPQNCTLSGSLHELEFCMPHALNQSLYVFLFPVSVSLQGPTFHHGKPAIIIRCYWNHITAGCSLLFPLHQHYIIH